MSRKADSWITQQKKPITRQDSGSALEGYRKTGYAKPSGPTNPKKISGKQIRINTQKFIDEQDRPNISASRPISSKDIRKTAKQIGDLKKSTKKKLATELAPLPRLERTTTLPSQPKDSQASYTTKDERIRENERIRREARKKKEEDRKAEAAKAKKPRGPSKTTSDLLAPEDKKGPGRSKDAEEKKKEEWRKKRKQQQQQKQLIAKASIDAEREFYTFLNKQWRAKFKAPRKNAEYFMPGKERQGTMWKYINPHYTFRAVGIDQFIKNHNKYTTDIEELNKTIFSKAGDKGRKYYEKLKKWNTEFYAIAQKKKQELNVEALKKRNQGFGVPVTRRKPRISRKNIFKPPPPQVVASSSGNPVGENQIVNFTPKKEKYLTATGPDYRMSKRQRYNKDTEKYEDFGDIILKIKSTGHVESIQEEDIPNNIKWIEIDPRVYKANTEEKYAMPTIRPPKGKFTSTLAYGGINKYFFNIGSNKCFEYDNNETGEAMKNILGKNGQRLEMRNPHISNNIWYSNPGDSAIWEQNLIGKPGYPTKGTIWDKTPKQGHDVEKKQREKILKKTVEEIKNNKHSNFITFSSPQTHYKFGFLDLNKKVAMGNGWYMLEFINNLDEMHLREEINKGPIKKNRTPVTFFISEKDIKPPGKPEDRDAWGKNRKILCEWEYRMIIIKQLTKNNNKLLVDIEKLIDFNTTERYCESGDMMRYNEYTNICGHNSLKAKEKWQEKSLNILENIKTKEFDQFKQQIKMMFHGLAMNEVIQTILNKGEERREEIVNDIKDKIDKITILKFRSGKPNSAVFPMPMKEIENIKNSVIEDIKNRVLDFFDTTNNEFEKLSEMKCSETEDCCSKTIKQIDSILSFTNSKNATFNKIISELKEYNEHLAPLLHMELLSKRDKETLKKIQEDLLDNKTVLENKWNGLITSDKIKEAIFELIADKLDLIINNRSREAEELQWVDHGNRLVSDKWETMKYEDIQWKKNKECIDNLINKINSLNNKDFLNNKLAKHIRLFKEKMNNIHASFSDVLNNYQDQHTNVITKLEKIPNMSKEELIEGINTEKIILIKEKMQEKLKEIEEAEEKKRKLKEAEEKKQRDLINGMIKASLNADEIYKETADKARDYITKKKFTEAMEIIQEGKKQKEIDDLKKAEKERKRKELDAALIEMLKKWKEKMKEQKRKEEEEDYRKHLIKIYNEAIDNNLKIRKDLEDIIEKLNNEEEKLISTEIITPEIHNILFLETCKIDDLIKAYKKDGYLMGIIVETITNITNTINKAKNIVNEYSKERLVGYDEKINEFIMQITDKLKMLEGWKDHLDDFKIINEIFDIKEDKVVINDFESPSATKEKINDTINKVARAIDNNPQKYIKGCLMVLKDKLNEHLEVLRDTTRQNTAKIQEKLNEIETDLGNSFVHYKVLCDTFNGTDFFKNAETKYDEIFKLLADKMNLETTVIIGDTKSEQYKMMLEKENKVEEYKNKYNEKMEYIDNNVRDELPKNLLKDIHEEDSSLFVDEEGTSGLLNRLNVIELTDIEEDKVDKMNDMKKRLEIDINAKNEEFLFYKKLLVDMGFNGEEKDMNIKSSTEYTNLINSLQNDQLSNYLCIKNLLKIKLLQWKTKAIHKEDGNNELLMKERAKTLKEGAEEEEKDRKKQERLAALAAIRKKKEEDYQRKSQETASIIQKFTDIQNRVNENRKRIEEMKKAKEDSAKAAKKERDNWNYDYLRNILEGHNRPDLKAYNKNTTRESYDNYDETWG